MRILNTLAVVAGLLPCSALAEGRSIIVLDGSGSMWGQIDGRPKLEIAREALATVLQGIPPETEIGLMAYGHRTKGDCGDIELVVPPAQGTAGAIIGAANSMKFLGKTPLTEAVRRAAADLHSTEDKATVILITDGIETCEADPCALGTELEQSGVDFTAHVVGFGLTKEEGRAVACLAENTGGKYIEAADAGALVAALETAVAEPAPAPQPTPEPQPAALAENVDPVLRLVAAGEEITGDLLGDAYFEFFPLAADGSRGDQPQTIYGASKGLIAPGRYVMRTTLHNATAEADVTLSATEMNTPEGVLDAGVLALTLLAEAGGEPAAEASWEMHGAGGIYDAGYAKTYRAFPAGEYELDAKLGEMAAKEAVVIEAGKVLDKTVILAVGIPVFTAFYAPGVAVEDGAMTYEVLSGQQGLDGSRESIRTDYGVTASPSLPPGDYVVKAKLHEAVVEQPFTLKAGERLDVAIVLDAGIAALSAPKASSIEIYRAKAGLDGKRPYVRTDYGDAAQVTLTAGDYVAVAARDGAKAEAAFTVKAAERVEVAVALAAGMAAVRADDANQIDILAAKPGLDGSREVIFTDYGATSERLLPPGDYVALATAGRATAEAPFTVKDGERSDVTVVIPRGVISVSAPGAREIAFLVAKPGLDGQRTSIHGDYSDASAPMLPPGDYVVTADFGDGAVVEQPVSLADGQRVELALTKP